MSNKQRFLFRIYGDSLTMPRSDINISFHETYCNIMVERCSETWGDRFVSSYIRHSPGATIVELQKQYLVDSFYFGAEAGDVLIIHCGISDCAPRPIPTTLRKIIARLPAVMRNQIVKLLHKFRSNIIRLGLSWRVVDPQVFRQKYVEFLQQAVKDFPCVCVVNIAPTTPAIEAHSPGLGPSIELYNRMIKDIVTGMAANNLFLLDVRSEILSHADGVEMFINQKDGHHITKEGHLLYADLMIQKLFPE